MRDLVKHSKASKLRWSKIPPEERSRMMVVILKKRWAKVSLSDRKKIMAKLTKKRLAKINK